VLKNTSRNNTLWERQCNNWNPPRVATPPPPYPFARLFCLVQRFASSSQLSNPLPKIPPQLLTLTFYTAAQESVHPMAHIHILNGCPRLIPPLVVHINFLTDCPVFKTPIADIFSLIDCPNVRIADICGQIYSFCQLHRKLCFPSRYSGYI
jgi:hypothetical protein